MGQIRVSPTHRISLLTLCFVLLVSAGKRLDNTVMQAVTLPFLFFFNSPFPNLHAVSSLALWNLHSCHVIVKWKKEYCANVWINCSVGEIPGKRLFAWYICKETLARSDLVVRVCCYAKRAKVMQAVSSLRIKMFSLREWHLTLLMQEPSRISHRDPQSTGVLHRNETHFK
jgi:hypothetical protein